MTVAGLVLIKCKETGETYKALTSEDGKCYSKWNRHKGCHDWITKESFILIRDYNKDWQKDIMG